LRSLVQRSVILTLCSLDSEVSTCLKSWLTPARNGFLQSSELMNKITILAFTFIGLVSCVTQQRCLTKFPPNSDTTRIVSSRDSIVYRDTLLHINFPGGFSLGSITIPCPPPPVDFIPDTARAETEFAIAEAWWHHPEIKIRLVQRDTTIAFQLDSAIREAYHWRTEYNRIRTTVIKQKIPIIYQFALGGWIGILILILLFLAVKLIIRRL
jgi:hypothetical protein